MTWWAWGVRAAAANEDVRRAQGGGPAQALAWFGAVAGAVLVPEEGVLGRRAPPGAVLVLTEGGQLMAHDLASLQPAPLTLPFQALPLACATRFLGAPPPVRTAARAHLAACRAKAQVWPAALWLR